MLSMLALGAAASTLALSVPAQQTAKPPIWKAPVAPTSRPSSRLDPLRNSGPRPGVGVPMANFGSTTELGGMVLFPKTLTSPGWPEAESALDRLKATLGEGAYVRWESLWHELNWSPKAAGSFDRNRHIVDLLDQRGLRSLMVIIPHPWPGSDWDGGATKRAWGAPKAIWYPLIAQRYRECVAAYRAALAADGMSESANAVQFGNEPAAGHPGGNDTLTRGTWSAHALWKELHRTTAFYGDLQVIAPAYSMLDEQAAPVEIATSKVPTLFNWTVPVDRRAMHFRFYSPTSGSPDLYASSYVTELARRAALVQSLPFPTGGAAEETSRKNGLWVTEGYVVEGDAPAPRAESWKAVLRRVKAGVPNVRVFFAFTFFPTPELATPDLKGWDVPTEAQSVSAP